MRRLILIRTWICGVILIVSLGGAATTTVFAQSTAPYLYYYHPDLNAWVIERADGTDSRLLGQGQTDMNTNAADGFWSHTDEWFAWKSNFYSGYGGGGNFKLHVISADGTHTVGFTDQFHDVSVIQWAANSDYVFVEEYFDSPDSYYLIDIPHERILWSQSATNNEQQISGILVGDYFVYWTYNEPELNRQKTSIKILSLSTGDTFSLPTDNSSREIYQRLLDPSLVGHPYLKIDFKERKGLWILDIANGDLFELDAPDFLAGISSGNYLQWSSDGKYSLMAISQICPNTRAECADLWLISPEQKRVQHIADNIFFGLGGYPNSPILWSRGKSTAVFASDEGDISIIDAVSGLVKPIAGAKANLPLRWVISGNTLFFLAGRDEGLFYKVNLSEVSAPIPLNLHLDPTSLYYFDQEDFRISPDERYVGLGNSQTLYDFGQGVFNSLIQHSAAAYAGTRSTYYDWLPDSDWLLTGQTISFASGGGGPYASMVLRSSGSERRELNVLFSPVKWLPKQAIAHLPAAQPESILPQPYLTLEHPGKAAAAGWNAKGNLLAVAVDDAQLYIWSFEGPEPKVEQIIKMNGVCGFGVFDCHLTWSSDDRFISLGAIPKQDYQQTYFSLVDVKDGSVIGNSDYPFEWNEKGFSISSLKYPSPKDETLTLTAEYLKRGESKGIVVVREKSLQKFVVEFPIDGNVTSLEWLPDREHLLVQMDCSLQEWGVKDGLIGIFKPFHFCVRDYVTSSNGHWAATESIYAPTMIYRFGSDKPARSLNWYAKSVSFTPDNCWLTASGTQLVTIWKLSDLIPDTSTSDTDVCKPLVKGTYKVKPS